MIYALVIYAYGSDVVVALPGRKREALTGECAEVSNLLLGYVTMAYEVRESVGEQGAHCHECQDLIGATEVRRRCDAPPRGSTAALPLLVGHSSLSGLEGERLVSVIQ